MKCRVVSKIILRRKKVPGALQCSLIEVHCNMNDGVLLDPRARLRARALSCLKVLTWHSVILKLLHRTHAAINQNLQQNKTFLAGFYRRRATSKGREPLCGGIFSFVAKPSIHKQRMERSMAAAESCYQPACRFVRFSHSAKAK